MKKVEEDGNKKIRMVEIKRKGENNLRVSVSIGGQKRWENFLHQQHPLSLSDMRVIYMKMISWQQLQSSKNPLPYKVTSYNTHAQSGRA